MEDFDFSEAIVLKTLPEITGVGFACYGEDFRFPADCLFESGIDVRAGGEGDDLKTIWERLDDAKSAAPDRTGRT
jgi:hypothetical protein